MDNEAVSPATVTLYETLIRLMKGVVTALEKWIAQERGNIK